MFIAQERTSFNIDFGFIPSSMSPFGGFTKNEKSGV